MHKLVLSAFALLITSQIANAAPGAVHCGKLLDVRTGKLAYRSGDCVRCQCTIKAVGPASSPLAPGGATMVDLPSATCFARPDRCAYPSDQRSQPQRLQGLGDLGAATSHRGRKKRTPHPSRGLHHRSQRRRQRLTPTCSPRRHQCSDIDGRTCWSPAPRSGLPWACDENLLPFEFHLTKSSGVAEGRGKRAPRFAKPSSMGRT
jgi:hypothetical protein